VTFRRGHRHQDRTATSSQELGWAWLFCLEGEKQQARNMFDGEVAAETFAANFQTV
jgi:hypothetical protein